jgi:hypothetical protein
MNKFAYKIDGVQREQDPKFGFWASVGTADEIARKSVHDNWLNWWKSVKNAKEITFNGIARRDVGKTNVCLGNQARNIEYNGHLYKIEKFR